jgi:alpha-1,6-mannosyltransferase
VTTTVSTPSTETSGQSAGRQGSPSRAVRIRARLSGFAVRERPSLVACAALTALLLAAIRPMPWGDDLTLHLSVLRRLLGNPLHPGNPVLDEGGGSAYYSPYTVALAFAGKPLGLSAISLYRFATLANALLLMAGLHRFVRTLTQARWAPPLALIGMLLWWGTTAIAFSGYQSLDSLIDCAAYPSTIGTALALHLWAWLNRCELRPRPLAGLGALLGALLLVHQFTAVSATAGAAAILVARHRELRGRRAVLAVAAGLATCAAVIGVWPYYHLWAVGRGQLHLLDPIHHALYQHIGAWYLLALPGLLALGLRLRRSKTDVLALMFAAIGAVVLLGWVSGHWSFGRSWPMLILVVQVALAVHLAQLPRERVRARVAWGLPVAVATAVGLWAQSGALLVAMPSALRADVMAVIGHHPGVEELPHADWLENYLKPTDVVLANVSLAQFEVAAHGAYNVSSPWYLPEISETEDKVRARAVEMLLSPDTSAAERSSLLAEYHVGWLLLMSSESLPAGFPAERVARNGLFVLYRVAR